MIKLLWVLSVLLFGVCFYFQFKKESIKLYSPAVIAFGLMSGASSLVFYLDFLQMSMVLALVLTFGWGNAMGYFFYRVYSGIIAKED